MLHSPCPSSTAEAYKAPAESWTERSTFPFLVPEQGPRFSAVLGLAWEQKEKYQQVNIPAHPLVPRRPKQDRILVKWFLLVKEQSERIHCKSQVAVILKDFGKKLCMPGRWQERKQRERDAIEAPWGTEWVKTSMAGVPEASCVASLGRGFRMRIQRRNGTEAFTKYCPLPDSLPEKKIQNVISVTKNWKFTYGIGSNSQLDNTSFCDIRTIPY